MKVAVSSINNYLAKKLTTDQMVAALERTEVEIEDVISSGDFDRGIVVARVVRVEKHPNADRLAVVTVEFGGKNQLQIVCGAPNVAEGQIVALAMVGAKLLDGTIIKKASLREVESAGMLCSGRELGVSDDHGGILVLPDDFEVGKILCDIWPKAALLDIKTQPNRWDQLSWIGLAREASGYVGQEGQKVVLPENPPISYHTIKNVNVKETGECKRFISVKLFVKNDGRTPRWLVDNLEAAGLRSISPVVDITNFVMLETGQPSHAYDAKKINGSLSVRRGSPAEKITTLDGVERTLSDDDLVIADETGAIGLAGVIGGFSTQVDENTTEILLEVANFDRELVRKTALRHGLRTEASARFERSLPLPLPTFALPRLLDLLTQICDARLVAGPFDQLYDWPWTSHVGLRLRRAERVLGMSVDEKLVVNGLRRLGFGVEHFSLTGELKKHLGKPYLHGASFEKNGVEAFDCNYLTSYIYSLLGCRIGETADAQFQNGQVVAEDKLKAGDLVFMLGHQVSQGSHHKRHDTSQVGIYMGQNKVMHAAGFEYKNGTWQQLKNPRVYEVALSYYTNNPGYQGARRYLESFNHILAVTVPWWRTDVSLEEDLIEEVIKLIGHDKLPATTPLLPPMNTTDHQDLRRILELKKALAARGLFEVMTYSFIGGKQVELARLTIKDHLEILNPLSREQQYLRRSLLPSHLRIVEANQRYGASFEFFEVSRVYFKTAPGKLPDEEWVIGVTSVGPDSLLRLKSQLEAIASQLHVEPEYRPGASEVNITGRSGEVILAGRLIGQFGQIRPTVLSELKIDSEISYGEVKIGPMLAAPKNVEACDPLPYSLVARDLSIEVDVAVTWAEIEQIIKKQPFVDSIQYLSDFIDQRMARTGRRSLAFRVYMDMGARPDSTHITRGLDKIIIGLKRHKKLNNLVVR